MFIRCFYTADALRLSDLADILHAPVLSISMRSTDWKTVQRFFTVGVCGVPVSVCVCPSPWVKSE